MGVRDRDSLWIGSRRRLRHQLLDGPGSEHNSQFVYSLVTIHRRYKDRGRRSATAHSAPGGGIALAGREHSQQTGGHAARYCGKLILTDVDYQRTFANWHASQRSHVASIKFALRAGSTSGEKPGGHGERCVAVGTLDMAIWDAAAKIADLPLYAFIAEKVCRGGCPPPRVPVYASGGYFYADRDIECLRDEIKQFVDLGFTRAKIKIGTAGLSADLRRVEAASRSLGDPGLLAIDAMNAYTAEEALVAAASLKGQELWWFEDPCDPHDFETQARVASLCPFPIAVGEALFSLSEAKLLDSYGGLDRSRDILLFDPVHCYGLTNYLLIVQFLLGKGWSSGLMAALCSANT
jgi:L-alanine-DL-glutamate epimerase-like enolase superfamily enzyme